MDTRTQPVQAEVSPAVGRRRTVTRWLVRAGWSFLAMFIVTELFLRALGLHRPVIYEATSYGYRAVPNQDIFRLGNRIVYNAYGMRSEPIAARPAAGVARVLCLGDSVTNGGVITDQSLTYPAQLEQLLRERVGPTEVLNASVPGWATANELGWLRENGAFGAEVVVLAISTHDLFQPMVGSDIVGHHPAYPAARPVLAWTNLLTHYIWPRLSAGVGLEDPGAGAFVPSSEAAAHNIGNVLAMAEAARSAGARFLVLFLEQGGPEESDNVTKAAKRMLFAALHRSDIRLVSLRDATERYGRETLFRDDVHPNTFGNAVIAQTVAESLDAQLVHASRR
jgi:lysophospholipase L1-like esterase